MIASNFGDGHVGFAQYPRNDRRRVVDMHSLAKPLSITVTRRHCHARLTTLACFGSRAQPCPKGSARDDRHALAASDPNPPLSIRGRTLPPSRVFPHTPPRAEDSRCAMKSHTAFWDFLRSTAESQLGVMQTDLP